MGIPTLLGKLDQAVRVKAKKDARGYKKAGVDRHMAEIKRLEMEAQKAGQMEGIPQGVADYLRNNAPDDAYAGVKAAYVNEPDVEKIAAQLNRGIGSMTQRGPLEAIAHATATNKGLRQGGLAALGAGTAVASGAALTEGAQQLLALMEYMQGQQQTEERVATSELAQPMGMV